MSAIAGIDQALWDIKGKALGVPVYQLLGGLVRDKMKVYSWVGGDRPSDVIRDIKRLHERGFDTFKMNGSVEMGLLDNSAKVDAAIARIAEIREAFGNTIEFGIDFHGRIGSAMAKTMLRELEPHRRCSSRSPCLPSRTSSTRASRSTPASRWPLESACTRALSSSAYSRPAAWPSCSPTLPCRRHQRVRLKIASMAEAYDVALAPHCPLGPVALAACLHPTLSRTTRCCRSRASASTTTRASSRWTMCSTRDFVIQDGYMLPFTKPGLGVVMNETTSARPPSTRRIGATRCGATRTAASPSGEQRRHHGDACPQQAHRKR